MLTSSAIFWRHISFFVTRKHQKFRKNEEKSQYWPRFSDRGRGISVKVSGKMWLKIILKVAKIEKPQADQITNTSSPTAFQGLTSLHQLFFCYFSFHLLILLLTFEFYYGHCRHKCYYVKWFPEKIEKLETFNIIAYSAFIIFHLLICFVCLWEANFRWYSVLKSLTTS